MERHSIKSSRRHIVGYYNKQFLKPHYNQQDGGIDYEELDVGKHQTIYYIPWSKKAVDEIIAKSAHSDKDTISLHYQICMRTVPGVNVHQLETNSIMNNLLTGNGKISTNYM